MKSINLHITADKTPKAEKLRQYLTRKYKNNPIKKSQYIVVIGGDGYMLDALKKLQKYNVPFYGINTGNRGFLLNTYSGNDIVKKILKSNQINLFPLEAKIKSKISTKKLIAVNEVSIFRQTKQTTKLEISVDKKKRIKELVGDGVLVATPAGSTAYNLSARGPILNLDSNYLAVTPISPFRPRGWRGATISNNSKIIIKNLDIKKRPVNAVADNVEIKNIKSIEIKLNKKKKFAVLYDKKFGLRERNLAEQFKF